MAKKVSNDRLADHPDAPGNYLRQVKTSVDGSYQMISMDPNNRQKIDGFLTGDGAFHVSMTKGDGEVNQSSSNGVKTFFDSVTSTASGHCDSNVGGGESSRNGQGDVLNHVLVHDANTILVVGSGSQLTGKRNLIAAQLELKNVIISLKP
jgi:hypothetical protein